jgi:hypothetical protein
VSYPYPIPIPKTPISKSPDIYIYHLHVPSTKCVYMECHVASLAIT